MYQRPPLRYFLYARKSNESDDKQTKSIDDQIAEMTNFAMRRDLNIVHIFTESKSAKTPNKRPVFTQMLEKLYQGEADAILTWKLNRLARNPVEGGQISYMLQEKYIKHIQTYSTEHKPEDNVLMMQFEFGMANQYSKDLSEVTKRGQRRKAERGWYPANNLPIGYVFNRGRDPKSNAPLIIPHPKQFKLVRQVWQKLLDEKLSLSLLKDYGDGIGIVGKSGRPLSLSSYHRIFTSEFYCGYFSWKNEDGVPKRFQGKHTYMVTEAEFEQTQLILSGKNTGKKKKVMYTFPFKGCLKCGECGCSITAEHKLQTVCTRCKHKFSLKTQNACPKCKLAFEDMSGASVIDKTYYRCTKAKGKCSQKYVEAKNLEGQVLDLIESIMLPEAFAAWAIKSFKHVSSLKFKEAKEQCDAYAKKIKKLLDRIDNLSKMKADKEVTDSEYRRLRSETEREVRRLKIMHGEMLQRIKDWTNIVEDYVSYADYARTVFEKRDPEQLHDMLSTIASNLEILDKKLCFSVYKPFLIFQQMINQDHFVGGTFEHEKSLDSSGDSGDISPYHPTLLALWKELRNWIFKNHISIGSYPRRPKFYVQKNVAC